MLTYITAFLCALGALRLILYTRGGADHRPYASFLAYALIVSFSASSILMTFNHQHVSWPQFIINAVFVCAVFSTGGNVVELFRPTTNPNQDSFILRLIRSKRWW